jgi:phosphorylcholine metabolism protein LicD
MGVITMTGLLSMLIHTLTREYSILRDIYILIEETTWLTNLALENDDNYQIRSLTGQRHQYNEFIKAREQRLRQTEEMLKNILGWPHFSMIRLLSEVEDSCLNELGKVTTEIHNIICSLARMDIVNYHLHQGKLKQENERHKLDILRHKAESAYLDYPQPPKLKEKGTKDKYA